MLVHPLYLLRSYRFSARTSPARPFWLLPAIALALTGVATAAITNEAAPEAETDSDGSAAAPASSSAATRDGYEESIVVTATRTETPHGQVGSSVTVIEVEDTIPLAGRLVTDVLRTAPGVDVRRNGGPGSTASIFLRGADSDHTLVLVDGMEVNDPSTPSRTAFTSHLTLDAVDRIEVLRGPQSPLYGGDAVGGVINIITRDVEKAGRLSLWTEAGSYSTLSGGFGYGESIGSANVSLRGSQTESREFSATSGGVEDDPYRNASLTARVTTPLGGLARLDGAVRYTGAAAEFDGFLAETGHRIDSEQFLARLAPSFRSRSGRWSHRLEAQFARHHRNTTGNFPSDIEGRRMATDWLATYSPKEHRRLLLGAEIERENVELSTFREHSTATSVYVQDQRKLGGRWFTTLGARLDDHSIFGSRVTYRAAAVFQPRVSGLILRASAGTGFKTPSIAERDARAFGGNPALEPETSAGADLGLEYTTHGSGAVIGATAFASTFDQLIVAVFDPGSGLFVNTNVDQARTHGLELYGTAPLGPALRLRGQYTFTDSEAIGTAAGFGLSDGSPLLRRPRHKGGLSVDCRFAGVRNGRVALDVSYVGRRKDVDPATFAVTDADGYVVVSTAASLTVSRAVTLRGRLENLLNEEYEDIPGFNTPGRSAYLGISFEIDTR